MKHKHFYLVILLGFSLCSCSTVRSPEAIENSIALYEKNPERLQGIYFNDARQDSHDAVKLLDILEINGHNIKKVELRLLSPTKLQVICHRILSQDVHYVKGKITDGTFQIKHKTGWFGIPFIFFINSESSVRLSVGKTDELIVQYYHYSILKSFGYKDEDQKNYYYYFDETLKERASILD